MMQINYLCLNTSNLINNINKISFSLINQLNNIHKIGSINSIKILILHFLIGKNDLSNNYN